jgi:hypothetical protein
MLRLTVHISVLHLCRNKDIAEMCVRQFKRKAELTGPIGICTYASITPRGEQTNDCQNHEQENHASNMVNRK